MSDFFIDTHCHLFSLSDIPMEATVNRFANDLVDDTGFIKEAFLGILGGFVFSAANDDALKKKVEGYRHFLRFFDQDTVTNLREGVLPQLASIPKLNDRQLILTPVIMDMETPINKILADPHNDDPANLPPGKTLKRVINRLQEALQICQVDLAQHNCKVLPFVGLDPSNRVFELPGYSFEDYLSDLDVTLKPKAHRKNMDAMQTGDILGVKLYPSMGFNPSNPGYKGLFKEIQSLDLPITVHCQDVGSYVLGGGDLTKDELLEFNNPQNWEDVLQSDPQLKDLRINFGHFGGDSQMIKTIRMESTTVGDDIADELFDSVYTDSWTSTLIRLLKNYPNTYADLSAFDWREIKGHKSSLLGLTWVLALDRKGCFGDAPGQHLLEDKLVWGSDFPMCLKGINGYKELFDMFWFAIDFANTSFDGFQHPKDHADYKDYLPERDDLFEKLVSVNPRKFLFENDD